MVGSGYSDGSLTNRLCTYKGLLGMVDFKNIKAPKYFGNSGGQESGRGIVLAVYVGAGDCSVCVAWIKASAALQSLLVTQRSCGASAFGDIKNLTRDSPEWPAVSGPVWRRVLD